MRVNVVLFAFLAAVIYQSSHSEDPFSLQQTIGDHPHILLVTAHPDDECLFFAPTLLSLLEQQPIVGAEKSQAPEVFSLCLSTGNADGLGNIRKDELERSLDVLGIEKERRWVVDHPFVP